MVAQLSGIALDADCPAGMHAAFERLKRRGHMACVRNVVSLRATRWGMAEPEALPLHDVHAAPGAQPPPPDPRRRVVTGEALAESAYSFICCIALAHLCYSRYSGL